MRVAGQRARVICLQHNRNLRRRAGVAIAAMACTAAAPVPGLLAPLALPPIAVELPEEPAVLGTVPVPVRVKPTSTRWARIMRASLEQPALVGLTDAAWSMSPLQRVAYVQSAVNHAVRQRGASYDCSDDGYWAPAGETLERGVGDCIDIAIAKMESLRRLGIPARDLYLTTGYADTADASRRGRESAALLVRLEGEFWLLTERQDHPVHAGAGDTFADFAPIITYGVGKTWIHGKLMKVPPAGQTAEATAVRAAP